MKRTYTKDLKENIGKKVSVSGWVDVRRDHGKLVFIDIRDGSGLIQSVILPDKKEAHDIAHELRPEWVVKVEGVVNERPEKMVNLDLENGTIELGITGIEVLSRAEELPFEKDTELNLDTYLDHMPLTLRSRKARDIFTLQSSVIQSFREVMRSMDFMEYQNPILVGSDGEGGASAFQVDYYKDKKVLLATSPQLYKQIMVGVFEKVFTTTKVFRAEKHSTTRHLSEVVQMDFEMGFINDHEDIMDILELTVKEIVSSISQKHQNILSRFKTTPALIPEKFPRLTLREAQEILRASEEPDLDPEQERQICKWAKENHNSDFVFITYFPTNKRPFYTYIDEKKPEYTKSFDLLFRGLEINSGGQRVHNYTELVNRIKKTGLDPKVFSFYLEAFKYGMPPHGGCSTGLERFTARILELSNIKEATLFPREINRIDVLLAE